MSLRLVIVKMYTKPYNQALQSDAIPLRPFGNASHSIPKQLYCKARLSAIVMRQSLNFEYLALGVG